MTWQAPPGFEEDREPPPGQGTGKGRRKANGHADAPSLPEYRYLRELKLSRDVFWLIDETLPRGTMVMVYGRGGSGKTYLGASLAIGLTSGRWHGREAEPGAVLYCAFERPDDAEDRLASLRERLGLGDLPICHLNLAGFRLDETIAGHIIAQAMKLAVERGLAVHIVIDTVSAALGGAKEDDEGLGMLRASGERIASETKATVFWLHHEGKCDRNGPRGHLVLAEACMVWWRVEEREDGSRVVHVDKANRGPSNIPLFAFRLVPFIAGEDVRGRPIQLCELQLVDLDGAMASKPRARFAAPNDKPTAGLGMVQRILLGELVRLARKHPDGVDEKDLRSAFITQLHASRQASGKPDLDANGFARKFRQTLAPMLTAGHVQRLDGDLLLPGDE